MEVGKGVKREGEEKREERNEEGWRYGKRVNRETEGGKAGEEGGIGEESK